MMWGLLSWYLHKLELTEIGTKEYVASGISIEHLCASVAGLDIPKWKTYDKHTHKCNFEELKAGFEPFRSSEIDMGDYFEKSLG